MPTPRTFSRTKTATGTARSHIGFTLGRLRRHSLTQSHVPLFEALLTDVDAVESQATQLADKADEAQVDVYVADDGLNEHAAKAWLAGESISKAPDAPWRVVLFGGKTLSDFTKPILGAQHAAMQQWPAALAASEHKVLSDLAAGTVPLLQAADVASQNKAAAEMAIKLFRETGERAKLFDKVNAARKTLYGELATLPHKHPGLAASFPDKFFRRDTVEVEEEQAPPTIASTQKEIERLTQALAEQEQVLKALEAKAEADAKAAAELAAAEAKLEQLVAEEEAKKKEKEELMKLLGKK
jgi:hypothetical protein